MNENAESELALSVVVCTYNNAALLAETLQHLAAQKGVSADFEVLVIDNNCTDETPQIVAEFHPRIAHLRRVVEARQGQMHARVRGVQESRAGWVAFVDDDNLLDPGWMAAALQRVAASPACGAFAGRVVIDWEEPPPEIVARRAYAFAATDLGPQARCLAGEERWRLRGAGLVCRKEALERSGWLEWQACTGRAGRGTMSGDDTEIVMRIARVGYELWFEPACELQHRITRRRLTWAYLRSLHFSFALADPILLGFRARGSLLSWAAGLFMLFLRRTYWLMRHGIRGLLKADARATTALTFETLRGAACGIAAVARLSRTERALWLGGASASTGSKKLRVLHLQNGRMYGGVQRMLVCLAAERARAPEMEPVFAFCFAEKVAADIAATQAQVEILGSVQTSRPWQWWRAVLRFRGLLDRERFDAVVCHGSWPLALFGFCALWRKIPLVLWMHNDTKIRNKNLVEILAGWTRPDLVVANSAYTAASLPLLFANTPAHLVLPCPVSRPAVADSAETRRSTLRAELETAADAVVITLAGRPEPWKGHADLLGALAQISVAVPWVCWIIGGAFTAEQSAFLSELEASARRLGISERVRFLGQREDVADLLAAADIFCQPNVTPEPFGIVFVEALYAGLPVVTTDHGGGREIVNADCGRLVPPGHPPALARALEELVSDAALRHTLSSHAPARGAQVSDPAKILPALQAALARLSPRDVASPEPRALSNTSNLNLTVHG